MIIDRINALCKAYGLPTVVRLNGTLHLTLDAIDIAAGMGTRGGWFTNSMGKIVPINPVGARVARNERHLNPALYHHLGREIDHPTCCCPCHKKD